MQGPTDWKAAVINERTMAHQNGSLALRPHFVSSSFPKTPQGAASQSIHPFVLLTNG
jgi:hypothetical protein